MNTTVSYRGYDGSIIRDIEDNVFHGKILGVRDVVIYHGSTPEEAESVFHKAVDEYLGDFEATGQQPPKPFASMPAHLPHELQVKAALFAQENDVDVESVLNMALSQFLGQAA